MSDKTTAPPAASPQIMAAVSYLLRPLVRLLLSRGITFQVFCDLARAAYVRVAEEEFRLDAKSQTDSRISLLTGLQRREVSRLRKERMAENSLPQHASISASVLAIWSGHPDYLDPQGAPLPLPRLAARGGARSFEALVQSVSKDFRPRVVLDEWLRQGIVTVDDGDVVYLSPEAFVQPQGFEEKVYYFGRNIHDHLAATVHNLDGATPPFVERCVYYDRLTEDSVRELAGYARTTGMRALHAVNKRAAELQQRDQGRSDATYRTRFGVYNFSEMEASDGAPES